MIFLPKNLGMLATLAGDESLRYALSGVHVLDEGDYYRCEVTDGRLLAIVCGPDARASTVGRHITDEQQEALEETPGGVFDVIVPAGRWKEAFRQLPKDAALGLAGGEGVITLALPQALARCTPIEGRWPDVDMVLPATGPLVRIRVNPKVLARLLEVAAAFSELGLGEPPAVDILFYGRDKPLGIVGKKQQGQTFDALMMPLIGDRETPRPRPSAGNANATPNATPPVPPLTRLMATPSATATASPLRRVSCPFSSPHPTNRVLRRHRTASGRASVSARPFFHLLPRRF